jgi:hypothetical protein
MKKVSFLESIEGIETLFTRGIRTGASQAGWETSLCFLRDKKEEKYPTSKILNELKKNQPDLICFMMDAPLPWEDLWKDFILQQIPKISVWFDDFLRSPHTLEFLQRWEHWQKEYNTKVFIWDGYWRREWQKLTNCEAYPIHLAADETQFDSQAKPLFPELKDFAVMTGTIPSLASLQKEISALPSPIQKILQDCASILEKDSWPISPYHRVEEIIQQSPEKIRNVVQEWLRQPINKALFHHQLWRWGKRIARLRGLNAIAKNCPVAVLSGHRTEVFAQKEEIQKALPPNVKFEFRNTTNVSPQQWSGLFRNGKFQIQITDPQSVEGGIPFRVFECAACETPLLSDYRKELAELFPNLPLAKTEAELSEKSTEMLSQDLHSLASEMKEIFLAHHTWKRRWGQITT